MSGESLALFTLQIRAAALEEAAKAIEAKVAEHARAFPGPEHELARLQFGLDGNVFAHAVRALGKGT